MKKYIFLDSFEIFQNGKYVYTEYELKGEAYKELLRLCFQYCNTMTLLAWDIIEGVTDQKLIENISFERNDSLEEKIKDFEIDLPESIQCDFSHYKCGFPDGEKKTKLIHVAETSVKHYKLCPELFELLTTFTDNFFSWDGHSECGRFEDPCFFREDGSCFLFSIVHEGEIHLYLNENEEANKLFKMSKWWTEEMIRLENSKLNE